MAERRAATAADAARGDDRGGAVTARRSGARDRATAREVADDELQQRIRSLEAERLRPVPGPPTTEFERKLSDFEAYLVRLGRRHHRENDDEGTD